MEIVFLNEENVNIYIDYLKKSFLEEPDKMCCDIIDDESIKKRLKDPFYLNTKSLLAIIDNKVVGRIEYHFYGCLQDGMRMAYVDWLYVSKEYRHQKIAQNLFNAFIKECEKNEINQFYLIRAKNENANRFYSKFTKASLEDAPLLRQDI